MHDIDVLTGLPNRQGLTTRLDHAMAVARRDGASAAVLFIDFDGFKAVNDTRGHATGDAVLRALAVRLRARLRDTDTVVRLGGDEFVVVAERVDDAGRAASLARKLLAVVADPVVVGGESIGLTASIGISLFPGDGTTAEALVATADAAMYAAKADGKNTFRYYSPRMHADAQTRLALERALTRGLVTGEFELHYQPEWDVASGRVSACAAALRWRRRGLGVLIPDDFLDAADRSGVSVPLGRWMLATACDDAVQLRAAGLALPIDVRLTARQVSDRGLAGELARLLAERALPVGAIGIDVGEQTTAGLTRDVAATLGDLHALGVALAVSGFGAGCSSIGSLAALPIRTIKLAAEVVACPGHDQLDSTLAPALVALGRHLGLGVVAEGVETAQAVERLAAIGCHRMQGAHFAQPLTATELVGYCRWACSPAVGSDLIRHDSARYGLGPRALLRSRASSRRVRRPAAVVIGGGARPVAAGRGR